MKNLITGFWIAIVMSSCVQQVITGNYSSKKADLGFFITKIQLNADSTFKYEFYGDLAYDRATGEYSISNKIIDLRYDEIPSDSLDQLSKALATQFSDVRPQNLFFKHNKLFKFKDNGQIETIIPLIKRGGVLIWRTE